MFRAGRWLGAVANWAGSGRAKPIVPDHSAPVLGSWHFFGELRVDGGVLDFNADGINGSHNGLPRQHYLSGLDTHVTDNSDKVNS